MPCERQGKVSRPAAHVDADGRLSGVVQESSSDAAKEFGFLARSENGAANLEFDP
ncbi:protein of unknown function [Hyphomicrobium sp. 1Nfss2.1]